MDFALGVFHDLHHALRHSLYEARGEKREQVKSRSCLQDNATRPPGKERSP